MLKKFLVKIAVPLNCFNKKVLCCFDFEKQKEKSEKSLLKKSAKSAKFSNLVHLVYLAIA